jgi:hypothetical protein
VDSEEDASKENRDVLTREQLMFLETRWLAFITSTTFKAYLPCDAVVTGDRLIALDFAARAFCAGQTLPGDGESHDLLRCM